MGYTGKLHYKIWTSMSSSNTLCGYVWLFKRSVNDSYMCLVSQSQPVEDYYRKQGKLMEFDLPGGIPESWPKLLEALNLEDYNHKKSAVA